jgi:filamentous hemagglutinin family protein
VNRTYRLVWNEATQRYVPAAEGTRARGKSGGCKALKRLGAVLLAVSLGSHYVNTAEAGPTGGTVASGQGTISQSGSTTTVSQQSQNLSLNWTGFSIAAGETVRFVQPCSTSVALNRVTGSDPSRIYGQLQANGQVFLINPNGVLFAPGAEVNVGSLVASTLKVSDADFQEGHYQFTAGSTTGTVDNQGHLAAAAGGYLALLGPTVSNNGTMKVMSGTVLLAAGKKVSLHLDNGSLVSYSIDRGALNALAENNQLIQADGGRVYLSARGADAVSKAVVNNTGIIEARTVENHNGVIRLLGDATVGQVNVAGTLDASAPQGGNGGTVETSAAHVTVADTAHITTAAPAGKTGTWSVDEANFTVAASGGDVSGATLSSELATTGVTIATSSGKVAGNGDIVVDDTVSWSANTTLTLNAAHNVQLNASITGSGNTAGLVLNYGSGDNYSLNGGKVTLSGNDPSLSIGGHAYTVINSLGVRNDKTHTTLQGIRNDLSGYYALGSDIDASATSGWTAGGGLVGFNPLGTASKAFTGQLAGLGHVISNLTINDKNHSDVGLFGVTGTRSVIRDVGLNGGTVMGAGDVGPLVGFNQGEILDSYATVSVSGKHDVGGLVGENSGAISTSYATGAVTGLDKITGGRGGLNDDTITNSYANGGVSGHDGMIGGLVGENSGTITNTYATGSVTGHDGMVGGLVGENDGAITDSYAAGKVGGSTEHIGGLVGYNTGNGCTSGTVTHSFWDKTTSGQATSDGGTGMTTAQMQQQANFTSATAANGRVNPAWDFSSVWVMYDGSTYPLLKSFLKPIVVTANNVSAVYTSAAWNGSDTYSCSTGSCAGLLGTIKYGGTAAGAINVGDYSILPSGLYSTQQGYAITYVAGQLAITPASLTITGLIASSKIYDATTAAVLHGTAKISPLGSDSVTLSGMGSGVFDSKNVGTGKAVTVTGYTISGAAASNYTLVEPVGLTANITPASLAIGGLTANNKIYDATTGAILSGTATVSALGSDRVSLGGTATAVFSSKNVGTGKAVTVSGYTLSGADASNYTLVEPTGLTANITPASLAIGGLTANNKIYDATVADTLSGTATVVALGSDNIVLSGSGGASFSDKNVGTHKVVTVSGYTLSGADAGNYTLRQPSGLTANISPASLALTGVAANNKIYDTTATATLSGTARVTALGSDNVVVGGTGSGVFSDKNAGTDKPVTVTGYILGGSDAGNYTLVESSGLTANISPANLLISGLTANNRIYNATATATLNGTATVTALGSDRITLGGTGSGVFSDKNVGTGKLVTVRGYTLGGADAGNYNLVEPTGLTANITRASLAVTGVAASNRVYDGTATATLSGTATVAALGSDSVALNGSGSGSFADKNVGNNKAVAVSGYFLAGADAANYTLVEPTGLTANITPASLLVSGIAANNKIYDTTVAGTLSGTAIVTPLGNDSVAVSGTGVGVFSSKNAGLDKSVSVSGYTLSGVDAGNYTLVEPTGLIANISPANLIVSGLTAATRVYDGTVAATLGGTALVSALGNDTVIVTGTGSGAFADKNVGANKSVNISGYAFSGADAANYTLVEPTNVTAGITARPLTVSATGISKIYDGSTSAAVTLTDNRVAGDALVAGYTSSTFADANVGTGKAVSISGISLSGADAGNYAFNTSAATIANITAAPLTITANAASKTFDGLAYSGGNGITFTGFVAGETPSVLGGALTYGGSSQGAINVGSYNIVPGGLTSSNYAIAFVNGILTIAPAPLVTAANQASLLIGATAYSGAMEGQGAKSSSGTLPYDGISQTAVDTGTDTLISGGLPSDAYTIGYVDGTLTITPRRQRGVNFTH